MSLPDVLGLAGVAALLSAYSLLQSGRWAQRDPAYSLTIYNASSSQYTLTVMSVIALIFVPIVLAYQGWTYYMFRKRISNDKNSLVY